MNKILVANRGEIALRIMRTAKEMDIKTVAVFSDPDRNAPHVLFADESVAIGGTTSAESYLIMDKIIEVAKERGCDSIHPGYGFLSENPEFVKKVEGNNITFIGPSAEAIFLMGSKLEAKKLAKKHNIPLVPGTESAIESVSEAKEIASKIGFPILIKASAGGGGKGMRVVKNADELESQMERAVSEAVSSFGDGSVFIERYVLNPRHIEIQVLLDKHGNGVHLFERECSIQRRHQKVVEEAPSVVLSEELRKEMGECALRISRACNYVGVGTVEFLLDDKNRYYFLEMNTRLQVEHPVTELITGVDLVRQQINVARNEKLAFSQNDLSINGHAIEFRVYAEDSNNGFLPSTGTLKTYVEPNGNGVRVDSGYKEGMEIPIYYDPMISKLVCYGATREEAIAKSKRAIAEYKINGVETTLPFCEFVLNHNSFKKGDFDTNFVNNYFEGKIPELLLTEQERNIVAVITSGDLLEKKVVQIQPELENSVSNWKRNRSTP